MTDNDPILAIEVQREAGTAIVRLAGELDPHSAESVADTLLGLDGGDPVDRVVLDLAGVGFIDSSGLRVLLKADEDLAGRGATLVLRAPSEAVRRLLEITDLLDRLEIE